MMSRKDVTDKVREVNAQVAGNLLEVIADTLHSLNANVETYEEPPEEEPKDIVTQAYELQETCKKLDCKNCPLYYIVEAKCSIAKVEPPSNWDIDI